VSATMASLPQFVRYLATFPPPQKVVEALIAGPLAQLGARSALLSELREHEGVLVTLGATGLSAEEEERYGVIPVEVRLPVTVALESRSVVVSEIADFGPEYVGGFDAEISERIVDRWGDVRLVSAPILHADRIVGALGFITAQPWDDGPVQRTVVDTLTAALGVWMTHPQAGLDHATPPPREWSLAFSARTREVLRQVEAGEATPAIAASLGVSESSIKADLQAAMKALRTSDRHEAAERARLLGLL